RSSSARSSALNRDSRIPGDPHANERDPNKTTTRVRPRTINLDRKARFIAWPPERGGRREPALISLFIYSTPGESGICLDYNWKVCEIKRALVAVAALRCSFPTGDSPFPYC